MPHGPMGCDGFGGWWHLQILSMWRFSQIEPLNQPWLVELIWNHSFWVPTIIFLMWGIIHLRKSPYNKNMCWMSKRTLDDKKKCVVGNKYFFRRKISLLHQASSGLLPLTRFAGIARGFTKNWVPPPCRGAQLNSDNFTLHSQSPHLICSETGCKYKDT